MPLISIIIPVYNTAEYLEKCIASLTGQTLKDIEIILIDDGSSDGSAELCDTAAADSRIRVVHKSNSGAAAARNTGLDMATGEYIGFVDSDDYVETDMYERLYSAALQYSSDLVICDCLKERAEGSAIYTHSLRSGFFTKAQMYAEYYPQLIVTDSLEYPVTVSNWTMLIRRCIINNNLLRFPEGLAYSEDMLFGCKVGYCARSMYYLKGEALYHYVQRGSSVTHGAYRDRMPQLMKIYGLLTEYFGEKADYRFDKQLKACRLFFILHCLSNVKSSSLSRADKRAEVSRIFNDKDSVAFLRKITPEDYDISTKLRLELICLKYGILRNTLLKLYLCR